MTADEQGPDTTSWCVCETDYTRCPHHPVQPWIPKGQRTAEDWERMYRTAEARRRGAERERDAARTERDTALAELADVRKSFGAPRAWREERDAEIDRLQAAVVTARRDAWTEGFYEGAGDIDWDDDRAENLNPYRARASTQTPAAAIEVAAGDDGDHEFKRFDHPAAGPGCVAVVGRHGRLCTRPETDPIHAQRATQGTAPTPAPSMFIGGKPVNPNETVHLGPETR